MNRIYLILSTLVFFFYSQAALLGQQPSMIVEIHGQVAEVGTQDPVTSLPIHIDNYGKLATDQLGSFKVPVPYASGTIRINVEHPGYEILNPPDGAKILSTEIKPNSVVNVHIWVLGTNRDEALMQQIKEAEGLIRKLRKNDQISQRQIQELNQALLDTISVNEYRRQEYAKSLANLQSNLDASQATSQAQKKEIESLSLQLDDLQKTNQGLLVRLSEALEEKYLKQKTSFDDITETLNTYTSRLKDLRDQLSQIDYVFKNKAAMSEFIGSIKLYSSIYEKLNGAWSNHSNDIRHYWPDSELQEEYLNVKTIMLDDIHKRHILPLNNSVIAPIRNASIGKSHKPKKIKKSSASALTEINEKINILEPALSAFLKALADF